MKTERVYLLLGSNIGVREQNLQHAIRLLVSYGVKLLRSSRIVESAPWGILDQATFLNQCIEIETSANPLILLEMCKSIEQEVGRQVRDKWTQREIDIDIIFYGKDSFDHPTLTIPHLQLIRRRFALIPLNELVPNLTHPKLDLTVEELLHLCTDTSKVNFLDISS